MTTATAMRLTAEPARFAAVRQAVREQLSAWGRDDLADAATLCVTEILANVHRHTDSPECELTLDRLPGAGEGVRLAVSDESRAIPALPAAAPQQTAERGRGLLLLAATADRWGTDLTPTGKQVWAVCALEASECIPGSAGRDLENIPGSNDSPGVERQRGP